MRSKDVRTGMVHELHSIATAYENLRTVMSKPSPMSRWNEVKDALQRLSSAIYGQGIRI